MRLMLACAEAHLRAAGRAVALLACECVVDGAARLLDSSVRGALVAEREADRVRDDLRQETLLIEASATSGWLRECPLR